MSREKQFNYLNEPLQSYLDRVSAKTPAPGGGSVAACIASLGAALLTMVLNYTIGKEKYAAYQEELEGIREETCRMLEKISRYVEEDSEVYSLVRKYSSEEKNPALEEKYLKQSAGIHLDICELSLKIIQFAGVLTEKGNKGLISDTGMAASLAVSSFNSARLNVLINLKFIADKEFVKTVMNRMNAIEKEVLSKGEAIYKKVTEILKK